MNTSGQGCQKEPEAAALRRLLGVLAAGYLWEMVEEIKSCQPEVKASESDQRLRSYSQLKICMVSGPCLATHAFDIDNRRRRRLLIAAQMPTRKTFDNPEWPPLVPPAHREFRVADPQAVHDCPAYPLLWHSSPWVFPNTNINHATPGCLWLTGGPVTLDRTITCILAHRIFCLDLKMTSLGQNHSPVSGIPWCQTLFDLLLAKRTIFS